MAKRSSPPRPRSNSPRVKAKIRKGRWWFLNWVGRLCGFLRKRWGFRLRTPVDPVPSLNQDENTGRVESDENTGRVEAAGPVHLPQLDASDENNGEQEMEDIQQEKAEEKVDDENNSLNLGVDPVPLLKQDENTGRVESDENTGRVEAAGQVHLPQLDASDENNGEQEMEDIRQEKAEEKVDDENNSLQEVQGEENQEEAEEEVDDENNSLQEVQGEENQEETEEEEVDENNSLQEVQGEENRAADKAKEEVAQRDEAVEEERAHQRQRNSKRVVAYTNPEGWKRTKLRNRLHSDFRSTEPYTSRLTFHGYFENDDLHKHGYSSKERVSCYELGKIDGGLGGGMKRAYRDISIQNTHFAETCSRAWNTHGVWFGVTPQKYFQMAMEANHNFNRGDIGLGQSLTTQLLHDEKRKGYVTYQRLADCFYNILGCEVMLKTSPVDPNHLPQKPPPDHFLHKLELECRWKHLVQWLHRWINQSLGSWTFILLNGASCFIFLLIWTRV